MIAEIYIGRHGRKSPINSVRKIINDYGLNKFWLILGWLGFGWAFNSFLLQCHRWHSGFLYFSSIPSSELNPAEYSVEYYSSFKIPHC